VLADRLRPGRRLTFVGGKGGVGKTTAAAALAVSLADRGEDALLVSLDPAHSVGDALGRAVGPEPVPVAGVPRLRALEVDAVRERQRFLERHRPALLELLERGTWLDAEDAEALLELPLPGADELAGVLRLLDLLAAEPAARIVVDTAPTGHALRLLAMPAEVRGWLDALGAMEARGRAVAEALAGAYRPGAAADFLEALEGDLRRFEALLRDAEATRFVVVTTAEPVVVAESRRLRAALAVHGIASGGTVLNRARPGDAPPAGENGDDGPPLRLPALADAPVGVARLRALASLDGDGGADAPGPGAASPAEADVRGGAEEGVFPVRPRRLFVVGGKGGVGKSTVASALAVRLADGGGAVVLLSTDPAGSLAEVWGVPVDEGPRAAPGVPSLELRQVDAAAAWARFRDRYREEAERAVSGIAGAGAARLLELAPPGVDELMALEEVTERLDAPGRPTVVLDTAPTGHLLRLLEAPADVLAWAHTAMRLLLRYRDVVGLGDAAERVLRFARGLRALRARLTDPAETAVWLVTLSEPMVAAETRRLAERLAALGMPPQALLVNRADAAAPEVPVPAGVSLVATAPEWPRGPVGAEALWSFADGWRRVGGE
jgi:arsenite/tail-anchored protein-transporting ATPase